MQAARKTALYLLLFLATGAGVHAADFRSDPLSIYYTSSLNGNLDGCTCKTAPKAGLVKRAAVLRGRDRDSSVLIELGDILDPLGDLDLAGHIFEIYAELGYDVIAVGDQEFADGAAAMVERSEVYPLVSHNLTVCPTEESCFIITMAPIVLERGDWRIAIVAVIDTEVFYFADPEIKKALKIEDPLLVAQTSLERLQGEELDARILLYHGSSHRLEELSGGLEGYDLVLSAHDQVLIDGRSMSGVPVYSPGPEGNRLGELTLRKNRRGMLTRKHSFRELSYSEDPDDPAVRGRIEEYIQKLRGRLKTAR